MALTGTVVPLALGGVLLAAISYSGSGLPTRRGRGLGSSSRAGARWARRRDVRTLAVDARRHNPGRLVLGTIPGPLRPVAIATEPAQSVVVVGPTQSGKTTSLAVPAILSWHGPVVAASVKSDLLRNTLARRNGAGEVWIIDPTASAGMPPSQWSPLTGCGQWPQACRVASDIATAAKTDGPSVDGDFWQASAAKMLAPLFFAAARGYKSMADVAC